MKTCRINASSSRTLSWALLVGVIVGPFAGLARADETTPAPKKIEIDYLRDPFEDSKTGTDSDSSESR